MKLSAGEKKLFVLSALIIALPLGVGLFLNSINAPPKVNIPAYPQAPKPNGYDLYVAAAKAIVPATPPVDALLDDLPPTNASARAKRYSLARKTAWLRANAKAFALFGRAQKTPTLAPSLRGISVKWPIKELSDLRRAKLVESRERRLRGDADGALQSGLDALQMGHDVRRGGSLVHSRFGARFGDQSRDEIQNLIERVSATQAKNAARRLEQLLQTRWDLAGALTQEKYLMQGLWLAYFANQGGWRQILFPDDSRDMPNLARAYTLSKQSVIDETGAEYDRQIANARLPYAQKGAPTPPRGLIFDDFAKNDEIWRFENARDLAGDQLLMLQLALRAYHLENGVYPAKLQALTPNYLMAIPADPFGGGEAMCYKLSGKTYLLWSLGPDGRDDGGTPVPPNKDEKNSKRLPGLLLDSQGDFIAGKNRATGLQWPRIG